MTPASVSLATVPWHRANAAASWWLPPERITLAAQVWALLGAACYAVLLWLLPIDATPDYHNYVRYAQYSRETFAFNVSTGWLVALFNEPLWLWMNMALREWALWEPETIVKFWSVASGAAVAWLLLLHHRRFGAWILILAFMNAQVFLLFYGALRQGVGLAVFMMGWYAWVVHGCRWGAVLIMLAPFVHISFLVLDALLAVVWLARRWGIGNGWYFLTLALGFAVMIIAGHHIATYLHLRQAEEYQFAAKEDISGLGWIFYVAMCGLFFSASKEWLERHRLAVSGIMFYVMTYWFVDMTARLLGSIVPLAVIGALDLRGWRRVIAIAMFLFHVAATMILRQHILVHVPS